MGVATWLRQKINSSYINNPIDLKTGVYHLDKCLIKSYYNNWLLLNNLAMVCCWLLMSRHETRYCYNMEFNGRIGSKLCMYDKSPNLNTSTWHSQVIVVVPPSGDRKWLCIACYYVQSGWKFSISSTSPPLAIRSRPQHAPSGVGVRGPVQRCLQL